MDGMIEVKNLVKKYGDHVAVDHLNFTVKKGQIYGFLGPNGAGKSTTMNIMTGYIGATEGDVIINGHDIMTEPEEAKKCIGYLPEVPPVYPDMTVMEYLKFSAELKKIPKQERADQIARVMKKTQVEEISGRLIRNLSKGYRQRVGLANALMGFPPIIILDEPTVGLDPKQIIEIRNLIKELGKEHTVVLSSHILSEISEVCDYVLILSHGKLVASDYTENLTQMMQGQSVYSFQVKGSEAKVKKVLGALRDVENVSTKPTAESGILDVTVECVGKREPSRIRTEEAAARRDQADFREEIFYALAHAECPMMAPAKHLSLEEVFLELTEDKPVEQKKEKKRLFERKQKKEKKIEEQEQSKEEESLEGTEAPVDSEELKAGERSASADSQDVKTEEAEASTDQDVETEKDTEEAK